MNTKSLVSLFGIGLAGALGLCVAGCARDEPAGAKPSPEPEAQEASADIQEKSGSSVTGTADFKLEGRTVTLTLALHGAKPGVHAVHIHELGDCSAADASSAGDHWNPMAKKHGRWGSDNYHLGDIGNVTVDEGGNATLTFTTDEWAIGTGGANDVVGKAMLVHDHGDDFTEQPGGHAGDRVACGVIVKL